MMTYRPLEREHSIRLSLSDSDKLIPHLNKGSRELILLDILEEIKPVLEGLESNIEVTYRENKFLKAELFIKVDDKVEIYELLNETEESKENIIRLFLTSFCNSL